MHILLRLFAELVVMLVGFALQMASLLVGCVVRLLYWSVRYYGWGRVGGLFGALAVSVWGALRVWGWPWSDGVVFAVAGATIVLWGGGLSLWRLVQGREGAMLVRPAPQGRIPARAAPRLSQGPGEAMRQPATATLVSGGPADGEAEGTGAVAGVRVPRPGSALASAAPSGGRVWDELVRHDTLRLAWERVATWRGAQGADGVSVEAFSVDRDRHLLALQEELATGAYRPRLPRWVEVPKGSGGVRRLAILALRDRVVQQALHQVLAPLWGPQFSPCSYAYRPGRSAQQAVAAVEEALAQGRVWVVDADIQSFFDDVAHPRLVALLEQWLADERVRWLLVLSVAASSPAPGMGIAQGAATSPLLANLFLHGLDDALTRARQVLVRYADLCRRRHRSAYAGRRVMPAPVGERRMGRVAGRARSA